MTDMGDTLYRRMQLIGYCAGHMPDVWRWPGFNHRRQTASRKSLSNGGADLYFRRDNDKKAALFAKNCRPVGKLRNPNARTDPLGVA